jgi:hypothetical protein
VPHPERPARTPAVIFGSAAWAEDFLRASAGAQQVAQTACAEFEHSGVPVADLRVCQAEGPDGTRLESCVKVYLPAPAGPHGMVFRIVRERRGRLGLVYAAFGLRHPSPDVRQPPVYQVAPPTAASGNRGVSRLGLQDLAELREHPRAPH